MLISLGVALVIAQEPAVAAATPLPAEIREYYEDHNFVVGFSTVAERRQLVSNRRDPAQPIEPRLREVRKRMERAAERVAQVDPGMVRAGSDTDLVRETNLLEIRSQHSDATAGTAVVELDVIALGPQGQAQWIADHPSAPRVDAANPRRLRVAQATHRWVRVDGVWKREQPTRLLIAR